MPTRRGRALLLGSSGLYLVARMLSVRELFAVAAAAALLPGLAVITVRWARYRMAFHREIERKRLFPGGTLIVRCTARNLGHLPSPPLLLADRAPPALGGPGQFSLASLAPQRREVVVVERRPTTRGRFSVGPLTAKLIDPFGLAEVTTVVAGAEDVLVYPRVERLADGGLPVDRAGSGPSQVYSLAPSGDEFYAVREYQSGDDLRKIHWRSVARTGQLMIRQDEARFYPRATILLDARKGSHLGRGPESSVEWAISAAASTIWHLGRRGFGLRLATEDKEPTSLRPGRSGAESLLETLAVLRPSGQPSLVPAVRRLMRQPGAGGALITILPAPTPEELLALCRLRTLYRWCGAFIVDVSSFVDIPPKRRAEADQRLAATEGALIRAGWRVRSASARDRFGDLWQTLSGAGPYRQSSASRRS